MKKKIIKLNWKQSYYNFWELLVGFCISVTMIEDVWAWFEAQAQIVNGYLPSEPSTINL